MAGMEKETECRLMAGCSSRAREGERPVSMWTSRSDRNIRL